MELLKTDGVSKVFGGLKAVSNFDIEINVRFMMLLAT